MNQSFEKQGNSALGRTLRVLDVFLDGTDPLSLADVARRLGLPRQTVHRLVRQLVDEGLLRRGLAKDSYVLGPRLVDLAGRAFRSSCQTGPSHALLRQLVDDVQETCNLGVLDGDHVRYIDRVECNWPIRAQFAAGAQVPIHATAIGKLLLAYLPSRARNRMLAALPLPRFTANTITDLDHLAADIAIIRKRGYSQNNEENADGLVGVAVPIRDPGGQVVAGLSVHAPATRLSISDIPRVLPPLKDAAAAMQRQLAMPKGDEAA